MTARNNADWIALTVEEPLGTDIPRIDAHHHLWDFPESRYVAEDFIADMGAAEQITRKTVFVECLAGYREDGPEHLRPVGETDFVCRIAGKNAGEDPASPQLAAAIVGFADLGMGDRAAEVLEAHLEAGLGRFRGIRQAAAWDPSPEIRNAHTRPVEKLMRDSGFRRGFACLEKYGLCFDAWIYHPQMPELAELARGFPETRIILDHAGCPLGIGPYAGRFREVFSEWKDGIAELAACDNVAVKLGGLAMPICGFAWHRRSKPPGSAELAEALAPYILYCIEQFGPDRCMFESNFPMDKASCGYVLLWNAFVRITQDFSRDEKHALFHDTAARVYQI